MLMIGKIICHRLRSIAIHVASKTSVGITWELLSYSLKFNLLCSANTVNIIKSIYVAIDTLFNCCTSGSPHDAASICPVKQLAIWHSKVSGGKFVITIQFRVSP